MIDFSNAPDPWPDPAPRLRATASPFAAECVDQHPLPVRTIGAPPTGLEGQDKILAWDKRIPDTGETMAGGDAG